MKSLFYFFFFIIFNGGLINNSYGGLPKLSDTVVLRLDTAEKQFLDRNLGLIASHFNIESSRALILQARLWNNPNFQFGQGLYNTASHKFFELQGPNSLQSAQIQQLFLLAGKRNKQVKIAQTNAEISEYEYLELLRTLKTQLRTDFYSIYFLNNSSKVYDQEIKSLERIAKIFSEQVLKGNVSKKEEIRIKSQLFSLENEYFSLRQQIFNFESDLNLLLLTQNRIYKPEMDSNLTLRPEIKKLVVETLIDTAFRYRYDLQTSESGVKLNQQTLNLQKALAVPDLNLGITYASNGSAAPNYFLLYGAIDLPFFNRNQGYIKSAQFQLSQSEVQNRAQRELVKNEVYLAYNTLLENQKVFQDFKPEFLTDFDKLIGEVLKNYQSRNLSLLEFLDFYDSYKQNKLQANTLQLNRLNAYEQINFMVGRDIIK